MSHRSISTQKQAQRLAVAGFGLSLLLTASLAGFLWWAFERQGRALARLGRSQQGHDALAWEWVFAAPGLPLGITLLLVLMLALNCMLYLAVRQHRAMERDWWRGEQRFDLMAEHAVEYGICMLDAEGRVITWNRAAQRIAGFLADEIVGCHFAQFYHPQDVAQGKPKADLETASSNGHAHGQGWRMRKDGTRFWADVAIAALRDRDGHLYGYATLTRDMTDRKQAEEALRDRVRESLQQGEALLHGVLDSAMDGIITINSAQTIVLYNRAAEKIFGWAAAQAIGRPLDMLLPARFHAAHRGHVGHFATTGTTSRSMGDGTVIFGQRASGEEFPLEASISQLETPEDKLFTVILRDVTERVTAQAELAAFAAEAGAVREQEKARIARELHDELAQSLTALKMDTVWVRENLSADPAALAAKLAAMMALLDTSAVATRRIAADLRPLLLDDLGLQPAIEWLVQNFTQRSGVPCTLEMDEQMELDEPYATAVFRIVQESLANVAKHANATGVSVAVARALHAITLRVRDDGRGFAPAEPRKPNSLGLAGLRERVSLLKGSLRIDSAPGRGTVVEVRIPVPEPGAGP